GWLRSPKTGGMSVAPNWRDLPPHRIPRRLNNLVPKATGNDRLVCWTLGNLQFIEGAIAIELFLRTANPRHGLIEPSISMSFKTYTDALTATQDLWVKVEGLE